jgi:hypothetical protein
VIHHDDRYFAMNATADVLYRARRFAVKHIEWALGMKANELGVRLAKPDRVVLMPRSVDEEVAGSVYNFLPLAVWVPGGDDVHLVAGAHEPSCEVARVILHAPDAMRRNDEGDDTDPHQPSPTAARIGGESYTAQL